MRSLHLTLMIFCQVLLASFIFYSALTSASPLTNQPAVVEQQAPVVVEAPNGVRQSPQVAQVIEQVKHEAQNVNFASSVVSSSAKKVDDTISARSDPDIKPSSVHRQEPIAASHVAISPQTDSAQSNVLNAAVVPSKLEAKMLPVQYPQPGAFFVPEQLDKHEKVASRQDKVEPHVQVAQDSRPRLLIESEVKPAQPVGAVQPEQAESSPVSMDSSKEVDGKSMVKSPEIVKESKKDTDVKEALLVGKSRLEPSVVPAVQQQEQVQAQPEAHQAAPIAEHVKTIEAAGVAEQVKKVEPVSASVFLVVQSPEPKITVVSRGEYHQPAEQQSAPAQPIVPVQQQVAVPQVPLQQAPVVQASVQPAPVVRPIVASPPVSDSAAPSVSSPVVNGGLGPLHLLANTLCNYQPDKPVADDTLNALYSQRASVRKSLFDFMSLKFTNLEKFSSRLNAGLEVMPRKTTDPGVVPSHGWPVVGKCTAHDLKLMAEAAWCETQLAVQQSSEALDKVEPKIASNHNRAQAARALDETPDQSAVISKILHVSDIKDAPIVESSIANLNLTQQQLVDIQAQATSTRVCRRNALKLTKALFNHLAEEQKNVSESWPQLYAQMANDDCARKRMIDIVNALSMFRTDSTSIRRDNVEFAFAMDDLRSKVLDSEVNVPLTFDKQFIEVEQFLQQSVKLMLSNIDPERAKLTQMRYRSLMPGPLSADDQCIELHQRLLAKNYPTDCNPTQFGQLPDVLRMAASSLELWSIENELSKRAAKTHEYPSSSQPAVRQDVNECIANLVAS